MSGLENIIQHFRNEAEGHREVFPLSNGGRNAKLYDLWADRIQAALKVVEAARGVGMNWKTGAPYGGDALDEALAEYDALKEG